MVEGSLSKQAQKDWSDRVEECIQSYYVICKDWYGQCSDESEDHHTKREKQAQMRHSNLYDALLQYIADEDLK